MKRRTLLTLPDSASKHVVAGKRIAKFWLDPVGLSSSTKLRNFTCAAEASRIRRHQCAMVALSIVRSFIPIDSTQTTAELNGLLAVVCCHGLRKLKHLARDGCLTCGYFSLVLRSWFMH